MEVQTWNVQGKSLDVINDWLEVPKAEAMDLVVLQEVGGLHLLEFNCYLPGGHLKEVVWPGR